MGKFLITIFTSILVIIGVVSLLLPPVFLFAHIGFVELLWYFLSFVIGLSMIVLPAMLPVALLAEPIATKKGFLSGVVAVLAFGFGVMITLSFYGILISWIGKMGLSFLHLRTEDVLGWVYFFSGIFVYIFSLSEIGLLRSSSRSYVGKANNNKESRHPQLELFFLGIFLGNIGIGGLHSGIPLLFLDASASGSVLYGWSLFFVHALGRIFPLLILVILSMRGVPALEWLMVRKEDIRRTSGWVMLIIAVFLTTFGFFGSDWFLGNLGYGKASIIPLSYVLLGNACLALLLLFPIWFSYAKERRRILITPELQAEKLQIRIDDLNEEHSGTVAVEGIFGDIAEKRQFNIDHEIKGLEKEKHIVTSVMHNGRENGSCDITEQRKRERLLRNQRNRGIMFSGALITLLLIIPYELSNTLRVEEGGNGVGRENSSGIFHE